MPPTPQPPGDLLDSANASSRAGTYPCIGLLLLRSGRQTTGTVTRRSPLRTHRHEQTGHGGSEHIRTLHTASPQKSRTLFNSAFNFERQVQLGRQHCSSQWPLRSAHRPFVTSRPPAEKAGRALEQVQLRHHACGGDHVGEGVGLAFCVEAGLLGASLDTRPTPCSRPPRYFSPGASRCSGFCRLRYSRGPEAYQGWRCRADRQLAESPSGLAG